MQTTTSFPSSWVLLRVWLLIGLQSFGGGSATLALMRRAVVQDHAWLTEEEFMLEWSFCKIAPGMGLLALAVLIGRRLGGGKGILVTLMGLLLPSVVITVLLSASCTQLNRFPASAAVLRGILPATVGLGLLNAEQIARSPLKVCRRKGAGNLLLGLVLLVGSGLAIAFLHLPVLLVLCTVGLIMALVDWQQSRNAKENDLNKGDASLP